MRAAEPKRARAPVLTLVPRQAPAADVDQNLLRAAEDILEGVRAGKITGLGLVVTLRDDRFFTDYFGDLRRWPWEARGWLRGLDDQLREECARQHDT